MISDHSSCTLQYLESICSFSKPLQKFWCLYCIPSIVGIVDVILSIIVGLIFNAKKIFNTIKHNTGQLHAMVIFLLVSRIYEYNKILHLTNRSNIQYKQTNTLVSQKEG